MNKFKFFLIGVLLIGFSLEIGNLKFGVGIVRAQIPSNTKISCENTDPDEFHSLRPYQANTECTSQTAKEATFCGNSLTLKETITKTYPGGGGNCTTKGNKVYCTYNASVPSHSISIDLGSAELPFMGNTEDVVNYKNTTDTPTLTDADKMNDYVSWYLGGVTNKKEYSEKTDEKSVVNYSGPLAKLLPLEIQYASRSGQVNQAKKTRHDQIVVCTEKIIDSNLIFPPFKWALEKLGIGQTVPTDCSGGTKMRLTDWEGDISILRNIGNAGISLLDLFAKALPGVAGDVIERAINDNKAWESRIPPLSWGTDPNGDPFNELTYRKAYNEWRGKSCIIIPVIKLLVCLEDYLVPNSYADMFSYIPMSSTEDVEGEIKIDNVSASSAVKDIKFSGQAAKLFFPHLEESDQLGSLLQDTYTPRGGEKVGNPTNVASGTSCNTVEVRSNPGDDLFADKITGNLSYTASFSCTFDAPVPTGCYDRCIYFGGVPNECRADCLYPDTVPPVATPTQTCSKDVYIELSTTSKIPMVDDIWSRLVAGPMAVFKRIFPKTNTEGSVGQIIDIPGSTNITYSGSGITQSNTDLKIPHIGGISEYFLKGIQTALRPKGMGEPITFAKNPDEDSSGGEINCNQSVPEITPTGLDKVAAENVTKMWYEGVPGHPYFKECNNDVIQKAQNKGIDPIFTLAIWIHESDASNYEAKSPVEDFGIHGRSDVPTNNFSKQLDFFLNLPSSYASRCGKRDMETFVSMFWFGECTPVNQEQRDKVIIYINDLNFIYSIIAPGITLPNYPN